MVAWFDHENPEQLCITDLKNENPQVVPLAPTIPAYNATPEQIQEAKKSCSEQNGHARTRISELRAKHLPPARPTLIDPAAMETARQFEEGKAAVKEKTRRRSAQELREVRLREDAELSRRERAIEEKWAKDSIFEFV